MIHTLIDKTRLWVCGRLMNKTMQVLLSPKVDNILSGIRVTLRVLLSDSRANLSEDTESLRGV